MSSDFAVFGSLLVGIGKLWLGDTASKKSPTGPRHQTKEVKTHGRSHK